MAMTEELTLLADHVGRVLEALKPTAADMQTRTTTDAEINHVANIQYYLTVACQEARSLS
jgi:hypothetical protein